MRHSKVAKYAVVLAALILPFIDYAMTLTFIGYPGIQELNPLIQTPRQILTFGVPIQITASITVVVTYYVGWVEKWAEDSYTVELTVLTILFVMCAVRGGVVVSNVYQTLRFLGVLM